MTEKELQIEKLRLEVKELSKSAWRKPTFLLSAITIIVSVAIGFDRYFEKVNSDNIAEISRLEKTIGEQKQQANELKEQELGLEIATREQEKSTLQSEIVDAKTQKDRIEQEMSADLAKTQQKIAEIKYRIRVILAKSEIDQSRINYIIASQSGQSAINNILSLSGEKEKKTEIGRFAYTVANQVSNESLNKIVDELELIIVR